MFFRTFRRALLFVTYMIASCFAVAFIWNALKNGWALAWSSWLGSINFFMLLIAFLTPLCWVFLLLAETQKPTE